MRGFLVMSAMVEDEQAATEVRELRVVLDRGRRADDLRISRSLTDGAVGAGIGAGLFGLRGGCDGDRCRGSCRQQHRRQVASLDSHDTPWACTRPRCGRSLAAIELSGPGGALPERNNIGSLCKSALARG